MEGEASPHEKEKKREKWVHDYNNSLPQEKWFAAEFDIEMTIAIGGIYDSEHMNFVFGGLASPRIKRVLGARKQKKREKCCGCGKNTHYYYTDCGGEEGVNMCHDCFT